MLSSDTLVAKHYLSDYQAGIYAGVSLTGKITYFAASSLFIIAFPVFSRHHDQGEASAKWILTACGIVCLTTTAIAVVFALQPAWVVIPLLGSRYRGAEAYVPWMAAVFGLYALGYLISIYLLARKRREVIAVLSLAVVVQFAAFFYWHTSTTRLMEALATAFGVLVAGDLLLVLLDGRRVDGRQPRYGGPESSATARRPASRPPSVASPRHAWQEQIVTEVVRQIGSVPVLLAGSRAIGTAQQGSDYDVSVVLPLPRIPWAVPRLAAASGSLSSDLGAPVSVNAIPRFRFRRPGGSLYVHKLRAEAVVLAAPPGWSIGRQPPTGVTDFAASSVLLSAVRSLLEVFDTGAMRHGLDLARGRRALRKAALHVAQVKLLRSGRYASDLVEALGQLACATPGPSGDTSDPETSTQLAAALAEADPVRGFLLLRECILGQLADVSAAPFRHPIIRGIVRNAQYAALARLRGRRRWRAALSLTPVEASLAGAQLALLRALDPHSADGLDGRQLRQAVEVRQRLGGTLLTQSWEELRDFILAEWLDAHPLVGLLA